MTTREQLHDLVAEAIRSGKGLGTFAQATLAVDAILRMHDVVDREPEQRDGRVGGLMVTTGRRGVKRETYVPPSQPLTVVLSDGSEWVLRPGESDPQHRLEVLLVPGSGSDGEDSVALRPLTTNRAEMWAVHS